MSRVRPRVRRNRQGGFIVSVELLFIVTILVIGLVVGWVTIHDAVVAELNDVAEAVGALDQTYAYPGTLGEAPVTSTEGSQFNDEADNAAALLPWTTLAGDEAPIIVTAPPPDTESLP